MWGSVVGLVGGEKGLESGEGGGVGVGEGVGVVEGKGAEGCAFLRDASGDHGAEPGGEELLLFARSTVTAGHGVIGVEGGPGRVAGEGGETFGIVDGFGVFGNVSRREGKEVP